MARARVAHPKDASSISGIRFGLLASEDIVKLSVLERPVCTQKEVGDSRLGLPQYDGASCSTCGANGLVDCTGHFGHIKLATPVYHPAHVRKLCSILRLICLNCGELRNSKKARVKSGAAKQQQSQIIPYQPPRVKKEPNSGAYVLVSSDDEQDCKYCSPFCKEYPHPQVSVKQIPAKGKETVLQPSSKEYPHPQVPVKGVPAKGKETIQVINLTVVVADPPRDYWEFLGVTPAPKQLQLRPGQALRILKKIPPSALEELKITRPEAFVLETFPVPPNCINATATITSEGPVDMYSSPATALLKRLVKRNAEFSIFGKPSVKKERELQLHVYCYLRLQGARKIANNPEPTVKGKVCATSDISSIWKSKMKVTLAKMNDYSANAVLTGDPHLPLDQILIPEAAAQQVTFPESVNETNHRRLQTLADEFWQRTRETIPGNLAFLVQRGSVCFDLQLLEDRLKLELGDVVHRPLREGDVVVLNRAPSVQTHSFVGFNVRLHQGQTIQMNPLVCPLFGADFDGDKLHIFVPQSLESKVEVAQIVALEHQLKSLLNGHSLFEFTQDVLLAAYSLVTDHRMLPADEFSMLAVLQEEKAVPVPAIVKSPRGQFWTSCQAFSLLLPELLTVSCSGDVFIKEGELLRVDDNPTWLRSSMTSLVYAIQQQLGAKAAVKYLSLSSKLLNQFLLTEGFSVGLGDFNFKAVPGFHDEIKNIMAVQSIETAETDIEAVIGRTLKKDNALHTMNSARSKGKLSNIRRHVACLGGDGSGKFVKQSFWDGLDSRTFVQHCNTARAQKNWHRDEVFRLRKGFIACLTDIYIGYDGTVRYRTGHLIRPHYRDSGFRLSDSAGEAVGLLAALSMAKVLYDMVQPEQTKKYLSMFKETLLSNKEQSDGAVVLRLRSCSLEDCRCLEARLLELQSHFRCLTLEQLSSKFTIEWTPGETPWVCHIYLRTNLLEHVELSLVGIRNRLNAHFTKKQGTTATFSVSCSSRPVPRIHFYYSGSTLVNDGSPYDDSIENSFKKLRDELVPELLRVVVSGKASIKSASIDWQPKVHVPFQVVPKGDGELVITVVPRKKKTASPYDFVNGAWGKLSDYVDWSRSCPLNVQEVCDAFGIEAAYQCILQGLRTILQELGVTVDDAHLTLMADAATHTGGVTSLSSSGLDGFLKALGISAPFLQAAQTRKLQIFEQAAENSASDSLNDALSSATWGKRPKLGTSADFGIVWKQKDATFGLLTEMDVDDFLACVPDVKRPAIPDIMEETCESPSLDRVVGAAGIESDVAWATQAEENKSDQDGWGAQGSTEDAWGMQQEKNQEDAWGGRSAEEGPAGGAWRTQQATDKQEDGWGADENHDKDNRDQDGWGADDKDNRDQDGWGADENHDKDNRDQDGWGADENHDKDNQDQEGWGADENRDKDNRDQDGWGTPMGTQSEEKLEVEVADRRSRKHLVPTGANLQPLGRNRHFSRQLEDEATQSSLATTAEGNNQDAGWGSVAIQEETRLEEAEAPKRAFKPTGANLQPLGPNKRLGTKWTSQQSEAAEVQGSQGGGPTNENPRPRRGNVDPVRRKFDEEMFKFVRRSQEILRSYQAGEPLSAEHQEFMTKVLEHHPDCEHKLGIGMDYIKVDDHIEHPAKCFFVVRRDGTSVDFSYHKCLQEYVRKTFPEEYGSLYERQFHPRLRKRNVETETIVID